MDASIKAATDTLIAAKTCQRMAEAIESIIAIIMNAEKIQRGHVIQAFSDHLHEVWDEHRFQHQAPYRIVTGTDADLLYIACDLGDHPGHLPGWAVAKLDTIAQQLKLSRYNPRELDHVREILDYCYHTFGVLSSQGMLTIAYPSIDIGCVAECDSTDDAGLTMIVNSINADTGLVESMAYEAAAIIIAGPTVPVGAIHLMAQTTYPRCSHDTEDNQYMEYLLSLKSGLSCHGPHSNGMGFDSKYQQIWHNYVLSMQT